MNEDQIKIKLEVSCPCGNKVLLNSFQCKQFEFKSDIHPSQLNHIEIICNKCGRDIHFLTD